MAIQNKDLPRFSIVAQKPHVRRLVLTAVLLWAVLAVAWVWLFWYAFQTDAGQLRGVVHRLESQLAVSEDQRAALQQSLTNAERADFISRNANNQLQASLADKDEQINGLKADLDFYERLVGSSGRRQGLNVHQASFEPMAGGALRYSIKLTQNINRGGNTSGQMRFAIDGVQAGKLKTVPWESLLQKPSASGQNFSFRYFQALEGDVMLPAGFTPQRVKVVLKGAFGTIEQGFDWSEVRPAPAPAVEP